MVYLLPCSFSISGEEGFITNQFYTEGNQVSFKCLRNPLSEQDEIKGEKEFYPLSFCQQVSQELECTLFSLSAKQQWTHIDKGLIYM